MNEETTEYQRMREKIAQVAKETWYKFDYPECWREIAKEIIQLIRPIEDEGLREKIASLEIQEPVKGRGHPDTIRFIKIGYRVAGQILEEIKGYRR